MGNELPASVPRGRSNLAKRPQPKVQELARERANTTKGSKGSLALMNAAFGEVYGRRVDAIDKKLGLYGSLTKQPVVSTGLLSIDSVLGAGLHPGFHVYFGAEASAKSTACMTALGSALLTVPVLKYFDAEGAIDRRYTGNILRTDSWGDVFGDMGRNGWIRRPRCRYHDSNIIEHVFRDMHRTASFMPDKMFREDSNEWYLVFDRSTEHKHLMKEMVDKGLAASPDKALFTSTGHYWCSIGDNDAPQAMFFVDSLPFLEPEKVDEEEISDNALGLQARYLGKFMALLSGKLRPKGIVLLAVNQLRDRPMPKPGQLDYYEPAGNAVKFASHSRCMWSSRAVQEDFPRNPNNKGICAEPSVEFEGGVDYYAFKSCKNVKNKIGQPFRDTMTRVWIKDGEGEPRGFDPVYDCYKFLCTVGAIEGAVSEVARKKFRINLKPIADVDWSWKSFKASILGHYDGSRRLLQIAQEEGAPNFRLRDYCNKLIASGRSEDMLAHHARRPANGVNLELEDADE